jgi:RNA polymerase-binding transcription factor DksA
VIQSGRLGSLAAMTEHVDEAQARERLEAERQRVEGLIAGVQNEGIGESESEQSGELADYDQHPADTASDTFEREKDLAILEQLEGELAEIEAALHRLDEGTYGVDEQTGEPIDPERLEAIPTARTNIAEVQHEPPRLQPGP